MSSGAFDMTGTYAGGNRAGSRRRGALLIATALSVVIAVLLGVAGAARAADQEVISSAGPMSEIYLNNDLGCQVSMLNDVASAFFSGTDPGACGTFIEVNAIDPGVAGGAAQIFGPPVSEGFAGGGTQATPDFVPVTQTRGGAGTAASPYTVTTTVAACGPATGDTQPLGSCPSGDLELAQLVETDTYVGGSDEYDTSLEITNDYDTALSGTLYHTGDCYLQADEGYGALGGPAGDAPECTLSANNSPPGRIMSFIPVSGPTGADYGYYEGRYPMFWQDITAAGALYPNSVDASTDEDNGMGVSWHYSLAVGASTNIGYATLVGPAPPAVTTGTPKVRGSERAAFSGVVDPDGSATIVAFQYGLDAKYGLTTRADPYTDQTAAQAVGSGTGALAVAAKVSGLVPHALYHVRVVATSADGTTMGADHTFTTASLPPPPPPVLGKAADFAPVSGMVYVKVPGTAHGAFEGHAAADTKGQGFIPLTDARQLAAGTQVDARLGKLRLTTATTRKTGHKRALTQSGLFFGGLFGVAQSKSPRLKGLVTLTLLDNGIFPGAPSYSECSANAKSSPAIAVIAKKKPLSSKALQTLGENEHGNYQTKGKYSAATVRGTRFSVSDRCGGTLTHVFRGRVTVTDYRTHKKHNLGTGQSYLAKAP
ncbi:MAG TPA: hypothetical protein VIJ20_13450 [Solirubrobacteraceae bacterium]